MMELMEIVVSIVTSLITGVISGWVVYLWTKQRDKKYQVYYFWRGYLFDALRHCEMYVPNKVLSQIPDVGGKESAFEKAIYAILDDTRPFDAEDREMTDREDRIFNNVIAAMDELEKWKKRNHLH